MNIIMPEVLKGNPLEFIDKGIKDSRQLGGIRAVHIVAKLRAERRIHVEWLEQQQPKQCPQK